MEADEASGSGGIAGAGGAEAGTPVIPPTLQHQKNRGRSTNRLSDRAVKGFIARVRAGNSDKKKLFDGGGLFLMLTPARTPVWRSKRGPRVLRARGPIDDRDIR
jgi:hypothetical protein